MVEGRTILLVSEEHELSALKQIVLDVLKYISCIDKLCCDDSVGVAVEWCMIVGKLEDVVLNRGAVKLIVL